MITQNSKDFIKHDINVTKNNMFKNEHLRWKIIALVFVPKNN